MLKILTKLKNKCGIYLIINIKNGNSYIGSSCDLYERLHKHKYDLIHNVHINIHLLRAYNLYKSNNFKWKILEFCDTDVLFDREQYYINLYNPEYNILKEAIRRHMTIELKNKVSKTISYLYSIGKMDKRKYRNKVYLYDILSLKNLKEYESVSKIKYDKEFLLKVKVSQINSGIFNNKYVILDKLYTDKLELLNFISENILYKIPSPQFKTKMYLFLQNPEETIYFKSYPDLVKHVNKYISSTFKLLKKLYLKHDGDVLLIPQTNFKILISSKFIKIKKLPSYLAINKESTEQKR